MNRCNCYHIEPERYYFIDKNGVPIYKYINIPRCLGTKENDACDCNGDKSECSFYESVRAKADVEKNNNIKDIFNEDKRGFLCYTMLERREVNRVNK